MGKTSRALEIGIPSRREMKLGFVENDVYEETTSMSRLTSYPLPPHSEAGLMTWSLESGLGDRGNLH